VGDGPLRDELQALAAASGLGDRIRFLEFQADLERVLAALDVFVHPSMMEGMPIVLYNAMAMGVPIIATGVAGVAEVLENEVSALLIPPSDEAALTQATRRLLDEESLRRRLAACACEASRSDHRFSAASSAKAVAALYSRLLSQWERSGAGA
jgi:glycosyltransferase involved in cell wall biosynthesis